MNRIPVVVFLLCCLLCAPAVLPTEPVSALFERVKDSIVVIGTTETDLPEVPGGTPTSVGGLGSGVLIDRLGTVLTAAHVVQVAEEIQVQFTSGEIIEAEVTGSVPAADLAVLKLKKPPTAAVAARMGDSDRVKVGDQIFIVGAPLGMTHTLTVGHISARRSTDALYGGLFNAEMFQTDAAINVGNSGGPMFNMAGEVIGIVSHMISQSGGYEGLGFVMTSNMARDLLLGRRTIWSGFEGHVVDGEMARILNLPQDVGILVQRVAEGSPASRMGLQPGSYRAEIDGQEIILGGDIILEIQGMRLSDPEEIERIQALLRTLSPGEEIKVTVLRGGRRIELATTPIKP
jgi:S1-C subfamily serine protease